MLAPDLVHGTLRIKVGAVLGWVATISHLTGRSRLFLRFLQKNVSAYILASVWIFGEGRRGTRGGAHVAASPLFIYGPSSSDPPYLICTCKQQQGRRRIIAVEAAARMVPLGRRKMSSKIYAKAARS